MSIEELPTTTEGTKIIVMAKLDQENTSWVSAELSDWQNAIYTVDNPKALLHLDTNKGREANAYLTYLVQNYESLPDTIVFLHSHRKGWPEGWHTDATDYDNVNSLRSLRIDSVQRDGYVNLRCLPTPGCPDEIQPFRDPPHGDGTEYAFGEAWEHIFGNKDVPKVVGIACCSQYAVSKRQVLRRPKSDYERFLAWLLDTKLDDDISGRVLEYMWHIIFGKNAVLEVLSAPVDCDLANGSQLP
ncbi:hypothetical protein MMC13_007773 [Lambiella insularis]|nr:hypothetical protein [Lambiella insularis]